MTCTNCGANATPGQSYCGTCGFRLSPGTLDDICLRLAALEQKRTDQKFLEVDTTEKVVNRLMRWAKIFMFFVGVPIAVILLGFAFFAGKSVKDLGDIASNARTSIQPILDQARVSAETARKTAVEALNKAQEADRSIEATKTSLSELDKQIVKRSADVSALQAQVAQGATDVTQLKQQIQAFSTEKNVASIQEIYPSFGKRVVGWHGGNIDPAQKKSGDIYVSLALAVTPASTNGLDPNKIGQMMSSLRAHHYQIFLGGASLYTTSGRTSEGLSSLDESSCHIGGTVPPCIFYFRQDMKANVENLQTLLLPVQAVPDKWIRYLDPQKQEPLVRELIEKASLDINVVLGSQ